MKVAGVPTKIEHVVSINQKSFIYGGITILIIGVALKVIGLLFKGKD